MSLNTINSRLIDDEGSMEKIPKCLNLFDSKPINTAFQNTSVVEYSPISANTDIIKFNIQCGNSYLDLSHCYLQTTFQLAKQVAIKDAEGKFTNTYKLAPITKEDPVSLINGFGATAIKNLKVLFNHRQIYNANENYAYNAYFRRLLGIETSRSAEDLQLAGFFEDAEDSQISGAGFEKRRRFLEDGKDFSTIAQLDVDFFKQKRLFLNNSIVDIEVTPHRQEFFIIGSGAYTAIAKNYKLFVKHHQIMPELDAAINGQLKSGVIAKYPYHRNLVNTYYITHGRTDFSTILYNDYVPKRLFVALVDAQAFKGKRETSPFDFKAHNVESIRVSVNSKLVPTYPYDFGKKEFARAYKDLADATENNGLTYEKYLTHSRIYAFDFQDYHDDRVGSLQEMGNTSLAIKFDSPVPQPGLQVVVYAEFQSNMAFDHHRNLITTIPV